MPTYVYECKACGRQIEVFHGISETPRRLCTFCGARSLKRLILGGAGLIFRGPGFYSTDYRQKGK